jgi:hypothetical protein
MSMFKRLFCCCLPSKKNVEHYECLIPKGVSEDVPFKGVPSTGVPSTGVPSTGVPSPGVPSPGVPQTHAFTGPLMHVHVITTQGDAPFTCCNGSGNTKGPLEKKPKEKEAPSKAPLPPLLPSASAPNMDLYDPPPCSSQLQWATFSNDMNTCQEKGALWRP